jgi:hypothetical protein
VVSGSRARAGRVVWFVVGLLARAVGAGVLFWLVFPLWLGIFWSVQGYPPTLGDFARWYAIGAFNAAPIVATVGVSPLILAFRWVAWKPSPPVSPLSHCAGEGEFGSPLPQRGRGAGGEGSNSHTAANCPPLHLACAPSRLRAAADVRGDVAISRMGRDDADACAGIWTGRRRGVWGGVGSWVECTPQQATRARWGSRSERLTGRRLRRVGRLFGERLLAGNQVQEQAEQRLRG